MSVNKYINGKLLQMSGNADTRLTKDDINTILGYIPADSSVCEETFKKYVPLDGGDTTDNITTFASNDANEPTSWADVDVAKSGEKHSSLFSKISTMFKNIRYLYKLLGTTDISAVGDGTVSGAINTLNSNKVSFIALNSGDANNITNTGIYWLNLWGGTSSWSNLPEYLGGIGTLIVNSHGGSINQTYMNAHSGGKTWQRVFFDNVWGDWICVTDNIQSQLNNALFRSDSPGYDGDNTTSFPSRNSEIVNKEFLSYWNGSYGDNSSNLACCNQGYFGSMCTEDANNYPTIETTNNLQNQIETINGNLTRQRVSITYYENKVAYATIPNGTWIITNSHPYGNGLSIYVMLMFGGDLSRCEIYAIKNDPYLTITIESANYVKFQLNIADGMENFRWINIQKIGN